MEKEYQRLEAERVGEEQTAEKSIADMATRMEELEAKLDASNVRLEAKLDASQSRLEAMFQQLLASRPPVYCTPPVSPRENGPTVSVMLPILRDEPRSKATGKEVTSPKLTPQVEGQIPQPVADEGCAEERTVVQETIPSTGLDIGGTGAGPSSAAGPEQPVQVS